MKLPKKTNRYCPKCKKKTEHKISLVSTGHKRGSLKRGSLIRAKKRNKNRGKGNKGRFSKKAIKSWKRKTKITTKKVLLYTCKLCKKSTQSRRGIRVSKIQLEEKK